MATRPFLLDRDDYRRAAAVLPKDEERTRRERDYRKAHKDYAGCLARQGTLAAEIASVSRELAREASPELSVKLAGLIATRECYPEVLADTARAYAKALLAWAVPTYAAYAQVGNAAVEAVDATMAERNRLDRTRNNTRAPRAEREAAHAALAAIIAADRPQRETRAACERGQQLITAELRAHFGEQIRGAAANRHDVERFVARHETRKVAA